eukprot:scaffold12969_cov65-Attheya_sp.AAC.9
MDIVNVELLFYCFGTVHVSSRSWMMAHMEPPSQGMDPDDANGHIHVSSRSRMTAHMEPHPARDRIQMTPMDIMTAHMEPHPVREWIQMTPMDIDNLELLFCYCFATVHVSSRSRMTAHMLEPHPVRKWIQMTPMDIVYVELLVCYYFATAHVSSRSRMTAHIMTAMLHESQQHSPQTACHHLERLVILRAKMVATPP